MKEKIKRIKIYDILAPFALVVIFFPALLFSFYNKLLNRKYILICEDPNQARDNGYELFLYLNKIGKKNVYYAINRESPDRHKFKDSKQLINFYSLKHWLYYLTAYKNISIHKAGSPSPALFYLLQKYKLFNGNRIFLQHGVTMNKVSYLHQHECNFQYFITAAIPEHKFIINELGYDENTAKLLGFSRFDRLYKERKREKENEEKILAIMPTWRSYLNSKTVEDFKNTDYYAKYMRLINDNKFANFLERNQMKAVFYIHRNFEKYLHLFESSSSLIEIAETYSFDIQDLIIESDLLITDYSSVSIDYAYMKKPVFYYQFDKNEFKTKHLNNGYFSYENDGFGPVSESLSSLMKELIDSEKNNFEIDDNYIKRSKKFFKNIDDKNNERIVDLIYKD